MQCFLSFQLQTFRHGFPHAPTAMAYDPIQKLLVIGDNSGSLRMYPFDDHDYDDDYIINCITLSGGRMPGMSLDG